MKRTCINLLLLAVLLLPLQIVQAQDTQSDGPIYIVQSGDNLWGISQRFGVSMADLAQINGISDPNQLTIGMRLVIPGLEGLEGVLTTQEIPFGIRGHCGLDLVAKQGVWTQSGGKEGADFPAWT